jgi:site-specific DNA-cytosine methylase
MKEKVLDAAIECRLPMFWCVRASWHDNRMLTPKELARGMSFPDSYQFAGNREQVVKQIGNSVPRRLAKALITRLLEE